MADKEIEQAIRNVLNEAKENKRNFKQTIDVTINLRQIDLSDPKNRVDEEIVLPNGRGKEARVAIFASGELAVKAKKHVDKVIKPEDIEDLADDKKTAKELAEEYDFFMAEAPLMPTIGKSLGVVLGPRGKMPRPVPPQADVSDTVKKLRKTVRIRSKQSPMIHAVAGDEDMDPADLAENIRTLIERLEVALPQGKMNVDSIYVKTTMGSPERIK